MVENDLILEQNDDIAETFDDFFKVKHSSLPGPFVDIDQAENWIGHPTLGIFEQLKTTPVL